MKVSRELEYSKGYLSFRYLKGHCKISRIDSPNAPAPGIRFVGEEHEKRRVKNKGRGVEKNHRSNLAVRRANPIFCAGPS